MESLTKLHLHTLLYSALIQGKAYRSLSTNLEATLTSFELTILEWKVLGIACHSQYISHSQIADALYVENPLITRVIKQLLKKSLLKIHIKEEDRRYKLLTPTAKGKKLFNNSINIVRKNTGNLFKGISIQDMETYKRVLEKIVLNSTMLS